MTRDYSATSQMSYRLKTAPRMEILSQPKYKSASIPVVPEMFTVVRILNGAPI